MWLDDEGLYTGEVNPLASFVASTYGFTRQPYSGTVLFASVGHQGEMVSLSQDQAALLHRTLANGSR